MVVRRRDDLTVSPKVKALKAIKAGNKDEAIKYIEEMDKWGLYMLRDTYGHWIQYLLGFIAKKLGEEAIEEAWNGALIDSWGDKNDWPAQMNNRSAEETMKIICPQISALGSDYYVEEDDEKFVINFTYCASGGRMEKEGKAAGKRTTKPYPWSFNQAGIPYYCCHEGVMMRLFAKFVKKPYWKEGNSQYNDDGTPTGRICRCYLYKEPRTDVKMPSWVTE